MTAVRKQIEQSACQHFLHHHMKSPSDRTKLLQVRINALQLWFLLSSLIYRISRDYGTFQSWTYTNDAKFWQSPSHHNLPSLPRPRNSFMLNQVSIYLNTMCVQVTTSVSVETPKNAFLLAGVLCFVGLWCGCCLIPLCSDAFKVISF